MPAPHLKHLSQQTYCRFDVGDVNHDGRPDIFHAGEEAFVVLEDFGDGSLEALTFSGAVAHIRDQEFKEATVSGVAEGAPAQRLRLLCHHLGHSPAALSLVMRTAW